MLGNTAVQDAKEGRFKLLLLLLCRRMEALFQQFMAVARQLHLAWWVER
jgi:hypothetical protein